MADTDVGQNQENELDIQRLQELVEKEQKWAGKIYAAAKYYISLGWPIIPVALGQRALPGRAALKKRGLKKQLSYADASTSPATIDHWFHPTEGIWRGMNLGLVCGKVVSVADIDEKNGKDGSKEYSTHIGFNQGRTPIQITPSGGVHIVFKHVKGFFTRTNVLNGVDTRGSTRKDLLGSHIVIYPSEVEEEIPGGTVRKPYLWKQGGIPEDPPEKLIEIVGKVVEFKAKDPSRGKGRGNENVTDEDYFPDATLEDIQDALNYCDPTDYDIWIYIGMSLHSEFDGTDGFDVWHEWSIPAASYKNEQDCWNHWNSFNRDPDGISIATLFGIARKNGYRKPGELSPELIEELRRDKNGNLKNSNHNLWVILQSKELQEEFGGRLKYDRFKEEVIIKDNEDPVINEGYVRIARWVSSKFEFERGKEIVRDYARMVAMDNEVDTLKDYVNNLVWNGEDVIKILGSKLYAANDYQVSAIRRWLVGGIARAMQPGCSATHMLILFGSQGVGKSLSLIHI